jgi:hypothetical protein
VVGRDVPQLLDVRPRPAVVVFLERGFGVGDELSHFRWIVRLMSNRRDGRLGGIRRLPEIQNQDGEAANREHRDGTGPHEECAAPGTLRYSGSRAQALPLSAQPARARGGNRRSELDTHV